MYTELGSVRFEKNTLGSCSAMSEDDTTFVDTRLYISVRPPLEYNIIQVGQQCIARLVGDDDTEQTFTNVTCRTGEATQSFSSLNEPRLDEVCSLCMSVCSMTEEYLRAMEMDWIEFLTRIHSGMHSELRAVQRQMHEVRRVRERYKHVNNVQVAEEIANEMQGLHDRMDEILDRYRTAEFPRVQRSEELRASSIRLRNDFGALYGSVPTRTLTSLKQIFEGEMLSIQESISRSFDRRLRDILKRRK